jgi:hypothetical protein
MTMPHSFPFQTFLLVAVALVGTAAAAPPAEKPVPPKAKKSVPEKPEELALLFDEDNKTFPLERFKTVRPGASEWKMGVSWTWKETIQLVRPLQIGTHAELAATLEFPPLAKDGDQAETRLGFVFADGQIGSVAFVRVRKEGRTTGELRVLREMEGPRPLGLTARSFVQKEDLPAGTYTLRVRCGALTISHSGKELGAGCFETHFAPAVGVVIGQEKGDTSCTHLTLRSTGFPAEFTAERSALVKQASALNEEGKAFFGAKKYDEALAKTKEALALYRKAHGDKHNDVANSLHNVATVLRNTEQSAEAIPFYEEAIKIRQKLFGEDHPDVALLELEFTSLLVGRKKLAEAFPHCLGAHFSFSKYYGSEDKNTIVTQQLLDKLPRPEKADET